MVAVPGGVSAPLSAEGGAGSEVPSALSTPPFSCRKRFLLNLALAFWNQTCKPIPIDFFTDVCFVLIIFVFVAFKSFFDVWFCVANRPSHSMASLAAGGTDSFTGRTLHTRPSATRARWDIEPSVQTS